MYVREYSIFSTLHPVILLLYALGAPIMAMLSLESVFLCTAIVMASCIHLFYYGFTQTIKAIVTMLPFFLFIAVLNMLTNPRGTIILFQIGHRAYTWESLRYGLLSATMLGAVLLWFRCFPAVIDNQKFLYLFGRRLPGTALLLSMILKLFPETKYKVQCIKLAQGEPEVNQERTLKRRVGRALKQISTLLEWSMEDSIETADSMKARGYGTKKRTSYEQYSFAVSDVVVLIIFLVSVMLVCLGIAGVAGTVLTQTAYLIFSGSPLWMEMIGHIRIR